MCCGSNVICRGSYVLSRTRVSVWWRNRHKMVNNNSRQKFQGVTSFCETGLVRITTKSINTKREGVSPIACSRNVRSSSANYPSSLVFHKKWPIRLHKNLGHIYSMTALQEFKHGVSVILYCLQEKKMIGHHYLILQ